LNADEKVRRDAALRQLIFFLGAVLMCWAVAVGADKSAPAPAKAPKAPKVTYDLAFRPAVGMRFAYESSSDSEITFHATGNIVRRSAEAWSKAHTQVVVTSEEITELSPEGQPVARRVTFGPNSFSVTQEDKQPTRKLRLVYAGKTVNFRLNPENDSIDQDFGVKPRPEEMRRQRNAMKGSSALFAGKPVTVGERWRADEGLRALANLRESDIISSIVTLKNVRDAESGGGGGGGGGKIAELAVSAAVITTERGFHAEISFQGNVTVDVKTGQILSSDLVGDLSVAGGMGSLTSGNAAVVSLTATGKMEIHARGRMLPPASATQPAGGIAASEIAK
jgi:hypothetical protein